MNIKSLLIGSTAALIAVSGARAADAVVAEPEAVEYVRVCDAYGSGFFYIPGTETCLKIGGYVRYDINFGERTGFDTDPDGTGPLVKDGKGDAFKKRARLSLRTTTKAETDLGTLTTYTETRWNFDTDGVGDEGSNATPSLNFAYIELGGLRIGKDESAFSAWTGYAGAVINDDIVSYGPFDTTLISYTFTGGNGFSAILSLEDDNADGEGYIPDVVGGVKFAAGDLSVSGVIGYDESKEEVAGKLRVDGKVGNVGLFLMAGYGSDDETTLGLSRFKPWGGSWALWGGASIDLNEKTALNLQASYSDENNDKGVNFGAAANVVYTVVPGFKVTTEVSYDDGKGTDGRFGGTLRFQRSF